MKATRRQKKKLLLLMNLSCVAVGSCLVNSRRIWVRPIFQNRNELGENKLVNEMRDDVEKFHEYFRMHPDTFDMLLGKVEPFITKMTTNWRIPISAAERLAITLRYLATGDAQTTISLSFRVGHSTVSEIVKETCDALWELLQPEYLKLPRGNEWMAVASKFRHRWNFPNCLGAIDGKHVAIQAPANAGSEYYNYKGFHSLVLLAVANADYTFSTVDIGDSGHHSDGGVFANSSFGRCLMSDQLDVPSDTQLPDSRLKTPYCFVGDAAFPLRKNLMRPYPGRYLTISQKVFNYRLSRARRVVENSFGILASRWRVFRRTIMLGEEKTVSVIKAACCLHNFMLARGTQEQRATYCPEGYVDREDATGNVIPGEWRAEVRNLRPAGRLGSNSYSSSAWGVREKFKDHFMSQEGSVPWQLQVIARR